MRWSFAVLLAACFNLLVQPGYAFNVSTHREMNRQAIAGSAVDEHFRNELAFPAGLQSSFKGKNVLDWTAEGGEREDDGPLTDSRAYRHFHDPLRSWDEAGLKVPILPRFDSSIVWMQHDDGGDAGSGSQGWSWPDARRSYYAALTLGSQGEREQKWADTFRALGQVMHLVEDAAQPGHVRNDAHGLEYLCREVLQLKNGCGGNFEYWVSDHHRELSFDPAVAGPPFDRAILAQATGHDEALVPVARLLDVERLWRLRRL